MACSRSIAKISAINAGRKTFKHADLHELLFTTNFSFQNVTCTVVADVIHGKINKIRNRMHFLKVYLVSRLDLSSESRFPE